ncbi:MAG: DUF2970 domain-containing protein [Methylovulum sp.]|uniref:DUF2970 domain-containing protein n=1 Tax=Methylovulum sp. TaxID=1916980 RepID=UPI0026162ACE|nr:DUF2970 domain-containing protein [Methylovulum sp.]MDD2724308.1 DUF2970 domain-containing protein [Methylovulum sp.]MDD5122959.1 DUF2970 domain-containing protein [Methylovulum sp.]
MTQPSMIQVIKSVLAAFIGVQSEENRQKDFTQGSLKNYLIGGVVFTVLFVAIIIFVVSAVLA